ncbi:MAG: NusG domain II-containing protein [Oscillospiraceae bacterium]|nr:NusG domain II-containing protein [Oscillospiraceae bacterium]
MLKTRTWIFILAAALLAFGLLALWVFSRTAEGTIANIYQDGECIYSIDLSAVTEGYELTIEDENGVNVIRVERGRICVLEADCPDQVCVQAGWLTDSASPIVCLPHRLVIRLEDTAGAASGLDIDSISKLGGADM